MHVDLIAAAPLATQVHLATVLPAVLLGGWLIAHAFTFTPGRLMHRVVFG